MKEFLQSFSNREISIVTWSIICIIILIFSQRKDLKQIENLFKMVFNKYFVAIYFTIAIYFYFIISYLNRNGIWEMSLYKDFIFWFLTSALVMVFNVSSLKNFKDFKLVILKLFSITLFSEFLIGFFNFSLLGELILIPTVTFISLLYFYADYNKEKEGYLTVSKFLNSLLSIVGISILIYVVYKIITNGKDLLSIFNLKSFIFSPLFTLFFIPIVYLIVVFMKYEDIFGNLNRSQFINRKRKLKIKVLFLFFGNINLKFLDNAKEITIWNKNELNNEEKLMNYIRKRIRYTEH